MNRFRVDSVSNELDAQKDVIVAATSESKLRIYAITVALDLTEKLGLAIPEAIRDPMVNLVTSQPMSLPYVCDGGVRSIDVKITKVAFIVIASNPGGEALVRDIANNEVNYIMIQQEVYKVVYTPSLKDDYVVPYFQNQNMLETANAFNDNIIIAMLSLANNEPLVPDTDIEHNVCNFAMQPFMGDIVLKGGNGRVIDTTSQIIRAAGKSLPIHVIAYRAL